MRCIRQIPVVIMAVFLLVGCNVLQEGDELPVLSANVLPSTAGSVLISGQGSENQQVELLAVANDNWRFSSWSGDIESNENPLNITLNENTELFANFVLAGNEYRVDLQLSDGENLSELSFGQTLGATDGFDTDLDLEGPPAPPDGILYARFGNSTRSLLRDFRNPYTNSVQWELRINPGNSGLIDLSWNIEIEDLPGTLIFTDSDESMSINMLEDSGVELNHSDDVEYLITYIQ